MADFSAEPIVTGAIKNVQPAVKGATHTAEYIALSDGDVVLFTLKNYAGTPLAVVINSSNALAVRT